MIVIKFLLVCRSHLSCAHLVLLLAAEAGQLISPVSPVSASASAEALPGEFGSRYFSPIFGMPHSRAAPLPLFQRHHFSATPHRHFNAPCRCLPRQGVIHSRDARRRRAISRFTLMIYSRPSPLAACYRPDEQSAMKYHVDYLPMILRGALIFADA